MDKDKDVVVNLFTHKYTFDEKMDVLANLELASENTLNDLIKEHHPEYFATGWENPVQKILLWKALKAFHEGTQPETWS